MKNSPDHDWMNRFEQRLRDYSEDPGDDLFENIASQLPSREPKWLTRAGNNASVASLLLLLCIGIYSTRPTEFQNPLTGSELKNSSIAADRGHESPPIPPDIADEKATVSKTPPELNKGVSGRTREVTPLSDKTTRNGETDSLRESVSYSTIGSTETPSRNGSELAMNEEEIHPEADSVMRVEEESVEEQGAKATMAEKARRPRRTISIYGSLTPQLAYHAITPVANDGLVITEFDEKSIISGHRFGIGFEAGINIALSNRLTLYGGLSGYRQTQQITYEYQSEEVVTADQRSAFDYLISPATTEKSFDYSMLNIGAQAGLLYYLAGEKLKHSIGLELCFQQGLQKSEIDGVYDNSESRYLLYQFSYRNEYAFGHRLRFYVQPTYSRSLFVKEKLQAPFSLRPHRAGLAFGITYMLGRRIRHI